MTVTDQVRAFIVNELNWDGPPALLTEDYALIDEGAIDSLGIFQMVSFIESQFGVPVDDEELVLENFGTLRSISALVTAKLPTEAPG